MKRLRHAIPMAHDEIYKFLQLPLTSEYLVVGQRSSPNLRKVLAWWNHVGATDQRDKETVQHLQVHGALAVKTVEARRHVIVLFVRECLALTRHLRLLLSPLPTRRANLAPKAKVKSSSQVLALRTFIHRQ